jgi:photosystem II stability/assembly factor-like uncharacterized protein
VSSTRPLPLCSVRTVVWLVAILAAGSCPAIEAPINSGGDPAHFSDLRCLADGAVVAAATIGSEGALLRSGDEGLHWTLVKRGGELTHVRPNFVDNPFTTESGQGTLRVSGYGSTSPLQFETLLALTLESTDGGQTWTRSTAALPMQLRTNDSAARVPSPVVVNAEDRLAVARLYPEPALLFSNDRGGSWAETRVPGIDTALYHVATDGRGVVVAVGAVQPLFGSSRLVVARSDDSGNTWTTAMNEPADHLACRPRVIGQVDAALMVYNPCRDRGKRYYLSGDDGRHWSARVFGPGRGAFELVGDLGDGRWVALSQEGPNRAIFAWTTDNGGEDWRGQPTGIAARSGNLWLHMQTILALPGGIVLSYIGDGQLLRSEDRGDSWRLVDTGLPRGTTLFMSAACNRGKAMVVLAGNNGTVIRSIDGGLTWQQGRMAESPP